MTRTITSLCIGALIGLTYLPTKAQFAMGADISWLPQSEALGQKYYDSKGKEGDVVLILKSYGVNSIRLRTWVNPNMNDPVAGHCSQKETIAMALRCKNAGMRIMIDFHYGDTWNSVGVQNTPAAWSKMTYAQMQTALHDYVFGFCTALKAAGVTPEWIANGNEINSGICHPTGTISKPAQMTGLLMQGYNAMKAVFPTTKVIIHVAQPQGTTADPMLAAYLANGGKWDVTGCSSYASVGSQPGLQTKVQNLRTKYGKEIMMVEIGNTSNANSQKQLIGMWANGISAMNKKCEGGIFWWEPSGGYAPFSWTAVTFDKTTGYATVANEGFSTKITGCSFVTDIEEELLLTNQGSSVSLFPNPSTSSFHLKVEGQIEYSICNLEGKEVENGKGTHELTLGADLSPGMYVVKIHCEQGTKFIKVTKN